VTGNAPASGFDTLAVAALGQGDPRRCRGRPRSDGLLLARVFRDEWGPVLASLVGFLGDLTVPRRPLRRPSRWPRSAGRALARRPIPVPG
jgi:hypothetical protein